jgi:hypothetical protein
VSRSVGAAGSNKRINLSRPGAAVVSSRRSPRRSCAVRPAELRRRLTNLRPDALMLPHA